MRIRHPLYSCALAILLNQSALTLGRAELLDEHSISQFAETWERLTMQLVLVDPEFDPQNIAGVSAQLQQMAQSDGPSSARDAAVVTYGYRDFETWANTAALVFKTAQWAKNPVDAADMDQALRTINSNQNQSADDKARLIADIKSAYEIAQKQKPEQPDIELVKRMLPLLEPIMSPIR